MGNWDIPFTTAGPQIAFLWLGAASAAPAAPSRSATAASSPGTRRGRVIDDVNRRAGPKVAWCGLGIPGQGPVVIGVGRLVADVPGAVPQPRIEALGPEQRDVVAGFEDIGEERRRRRLGVGAVTAGDGGEPGGAGERGMARCRAEDGVAERVRGPHRPRRRRRRRGDRRAAAGTPRRCRRTRLHGAAGSRSGRGPPARRGCGRARCPPGWARRRRSRAAPSNRGASARQVSPNLRWASGIGASPSQMRCTTRGMSEPCRGRISRRAGGAGGGVTTASSRRSPDSQRTFSSTTPRSSQTGPARPGASAPRRDHAGAPGASVTGSGVRTPSASEPSAQRHRCARNTPSPPSARPSSTRWLRLVSRTVTVRPTPASKRRSRSSSSSSDLAARCGTRAAARSRLEARTAGAPRDEGGHRRPLGAGEGSGRQLREPLRLVDPDLGLAQRPRPAAVPHLVGEHLGPALGRGLQQAVEVQQRLDDPGAGRAGLRRRMQATGEASAGGADEADLEIRPPRLLVHPVLPVFRHPATGDRVLADPIVGEQLRQPRDQRRRGDLIRVDAQHPLVGARPMDRGQVALHHPRGHDEDPIREGLELGRARREAPVHADHDLGRDARAAARPPRGSAPARHASRSRPRARGRAQTARVARWLATTSSRISSRTFVGAQPSVSLILVEVRDAPHHVLEAGLVGLLVGDRAGPRTPSRSAHGPDRPAARSRPPRRSRC